MTKKTFFRPRTKSQILSLDKKKEIYTLRNLADRLIQEKEKDCAYLIRTNIIPVSYSHRKRNEMTAAREYEKRGPTLSLVHSVTSNNCNIQKRTLRGILLDSMQNNREFLNPFDNEFVGYSFQPKSEDRIKRTVFFSDLLNGALLYLYSYFFAPISVEDKYSGIDCEDSRGADIIVSVPSRKRKKERYKFRMTHVPFHSKANNLDVSLTLKTSSSGREEFVRPEREDYAIRYRGGNFQESPERVVFLPQDIAAYHAIAQKQKKKGNSEPADFSPFPFPSPELIEVLTTLRDNCLILKKNLSSDEYRPIYELTEKSRILSILISKNLGRFDSLFTQEINEETYRGVFK